MDRYLADPDCMFLFTAAGYRDLLTLQREANSSFWFQSLCITLPVLLIAGEEDPVGDYGRGVTEVFTRMQAAGVRDVSMILYPQDRHELLQELDADQVQEDILTWLCNHLPA